MEEKATKDRGVLPRYIRVLVLEIYKEEGEGEKRSTRHSGIRCREKFRKKIKKYVH